MRYWQGLFVAGFLFLCFGCGEAEESVSADDRTVFRYNEAAGISSLDPAMASNLENIWAINQLYNGLVQMNGDMEVSPCIAERWEISEDGREYTFYLRKDVRFHDHPLFEGGKGRAMVAEDFVYSFWRVMDPATISVGASYLSILDRNENNNYTGVKAVDDYTLKMYLSEPFPPFLGIMTMQYFSVVPHEVAEHYGVDFRKNPVGTGPFKFKIWKEDVKLVLLKNEHYWETNEAGETLPHLDAVSISFIRDHPTAFKEFVQGKFDFHSGIQGNIKDMVLTHEGTLQDAYDGKFTLLKEPFLKTDYLGILIDDKMPIVKESPLRHQNVRRAINYAIDREELIYSQRNGIGRPALAGFVPPGIPSYNDTAVQGFEYNIEKARSLMQLAGYDLQGEELKVTLTTTESYRELCEYVQRKLQDIDLKVEVDIIEDSKARLYVATGQVNFFRKSWVADYLDAENFMQMFLSENWSPDNGANYFHFKSSVFDGLYHQAMREQNDSARYALYNQMDQLILEEAPIVPLYYDEVVRFVKPDVEGLPMNPMNLLILKEVRKTKATAEAQ